MIRLALVCGGLMFCLTLSAQQPAMLPGFLKVRVPNDAVLSVDGVPVKQTGPVRLLVTPALPVGKKGLYTLSATFMRDGKAVIVEKKIIVEPGREVEADLTQPDPAPIVKIEPKKIEEPKKIDLPPVTKVEEPKKIDVPPVTKVEEPKKVDLPPIVKVDEPKKIDLPPIVKVEEPKKAPPALDVPYVPTPEAVVLAMLKLAEVRPTDVVYDLGCGDGRIVISAVKDFQAKRGLGLELAPERVLLSKENAIKAKVDDKVEIREGNVLELKDVSEASVVTLYLFPEVNRKLMPILQKTLKPGSRIVSHDFDMGDWKAEKEITVPVQGDRDHTVYLWRIPEAKVEPIRKQDPIPKEEPALKLDPSKKVKLDVPYVPTPQPVVTAMLKLADVKAGDVVYDLGCGDGRIVVTAVKDFGAKSGFGIDLDPKRVLDSMQTAKKANVEANVKFREGNVLELKDVSEASVVTLYLFPEVNKKLMPMLKSTLKPGSRVVSHDFDMGKDWPATKEVHVMDENGLEHTLYLWKIEAK